MSWVQMLFGGYSFKCLLVVTGSNVFSGFMYECVLVVSWLSVILGLYFQMAFGGFGLNVEVRFLLVRFVSVL